MIGALGVSDRRRVPSAAQNAESFKLSSRACPLLLQPGKTKAAPKHEHPLRQGIDGRTHLRGWNGEGIYGRPNLGVSHKSWSIRDLVGGIGGPQLRPGVPIRRQSGGSVIGGHFVDSGPISIGKCCWWRLASGDKEQERQRRQAFS